MSYRDIQDNESISRWWEIWYDPSHATICCFFSI